MAANTSFFKNTGTSTQLQGSASASAAAALASEQAALASQTAAATSQTSAAASAAASASSAAQSLASANSSAASQSNAATSAANALASSANAQDWAVKTTGLVDSTDYASKAWAIGGTGVTGGDGASKEWSTLLGSTVDGSEYSAKHYSQVAATEAADAAADAVATAADRVQTGLDVVAAAGSATAASNSQIAAASSAAAAAATLDTFDDRYLGSYGSDPTVDNDGNALVTGALYFSSTANEMRVFDGANWIAASSAGGASLLNYNFTATAAQTAFSGSDDNSNTLGYTVDNLIVTRNGVMLEDGTDYTATDGSTITLAVAASAGDEINVVAFKSFTTADMVSATNGGTFQGNVDFAAGIDVIGNATFGTNDKAIFGAGSDLQIYHDGSHSRIAEAGTGDLKIGTSGGAVRITANGVSDNMIVANQGGSVTLSHSGNTKLATTATGVDVTGTISSNKGSAGTLATFTDGVNSNFVIETSSLLTTIGNGGGSTALAFKANNTEAMRIDSSGNVGIGTTTASNLLTLGASGGPTMRLTDTSSGVFGLIQSGSNGDFTISADHGSAGASTNILFKTDGATERMRIDSSGNVGIGTASPSANLDVASSNATIHLTDTDDTTYGEIRNNGGTFTIASDEGQSATNSSINFRVDAAEAMRIDSSGNVGIGTSSPNRQLTVSNSGAALFSLVSTGDDNCQVLFGDSASDTVGKVVYSHTSNAMSFETNGAERLRLHGAGGLSIGTPNIYSSAFISIQPDDTNRIINTRSYDTSSQYHLLFQNSSGNAVGNIFVTTTSTAYNTSSDYRLKTDVTYDWDATTRLKQLKPARFKWVADGDDAVFVDGFLAHECEAVPEAITGTKDAMRDEEYEVTPAVLDEDGNEVTPAVMGTRSVPDYQGIDQSKLVPLLVKTIQELEARISALEAN